MPSSTGDLGTPAAHTHFHTAACVMVKCCSCGAHLVRPAAHICAGRAPQRQNASNLGSLSFPKSQSTVFLCPHDAVLLIAPAADSASRLAHGRCSIDVAALNRLFEQVNSVPTCCWWCECSGPREDATRIGSAGVIRRQAVDISPLRRVNSAIYLISTGAREASFRNIKTIAECLADELINAAKGSSNR